MPRIELIPEVLYRPLDPYHHVVDNLPLQNLIRRQNLINSAVDNNSEQIRESIGTQGSLSNRLNQSINEDGSLKKDAVDEANHSIENHIDTDDYVRMTRNQSEKLNLIANNAKNFSINVFSNSSDFVSFDDGILDVKPSSSITPVFESPNTLKFEMSFPEESAHRHFYGLSPIAESSYEYSIPGYSSFIDGSLKVYINGVRIFEDESIYYPSNHTGTLTWTLMSFSSNPSDGTFTLYYPIHEDDIIKIDFDISLV